MTVLARRLGRTEAIALSIAILAPTAAMAFNVSLTARVAGRAAPLAFLIGTLVVAIVARCFVAFARRVAHAGSAFAYIALTFGHRCGFIAGWSLLLTYLTYAAGVGAMAANFVQAALANYGMGSTSYWVGLAAGSILLAAWCSYRDMRIAARMMLVLEGFSLLGVLALSLVIVCNAVTHTGLSTQPFVPSPSGGWSGIGYGLVFTVLSFAGFEGAATLGEETVNPRRSVPWAIAATVVLAGGFYVLVSYAQVIGYGLDQVDALANASAPLNELAIRYVSTRFATVIDLAAAISAFSCVLGSLCAAARLLFALCRAGLAPRLGMVHPSYRTPARAITVCTVLALAALLFCAEFAGAADSAAWLATIGTLALILVYIGVTAAETVVTVAARRSIPALFGAAGTLALLWPLYNSVYPMPDFLGSLWPYVVVAWIAAGAFLLALRPAMAPAALPATPGSSD